MLDVLIAGGGPAGSIAGWVLARAGARVLIVDRDEFPRDKLCGDTLNPGAIAFLESIGLGDGPWRSGPALTGMLISGPRNSVRATYPEGVVGRSITRTDLDAWLLERAISAGARFEAGWTVREPLVEQGSPSPDRRTRTSPAGEVHVRGLSMTRRGRATPLRIPGSLTIAADGRRSVLAHSLGLVQHPAKPRRWAFGAYATGVTGVETVGEMHIRAGHYIGVAPVRDGVVNVCVVTGPKPEGRRPAEVVWNHVRRDPGLAARFATASLVSGVRVLGPLALDARGAGIDGLLLAGDSAGFVDPMTGDGLRLAMTGAALAAHEALSALERGDLTGVAARLEASRKAAFGRKLRFNRLMRATVESPLAITLAGVSAAVMPSIIHSVVRYAGDAA
jgi:flavin-dependent dehydrogenase